MTHSAPPVNEIRDISASWPLRTHLDLPPEPSSVPNARKFAALMAAEWGLVDLAEGLRYVVSELFSNALDHAPPIAPVHLWLLSDSVRVVVLVGDASRNPPVRQAEDTDATGGRGLAIVHELTCGQWGWFSRSTSKAVWAMIGR